MTAPPTFQGQPVPVVIWDGRLITRSRAAGMSGTWALTMDPPYLRCAGCGGNVTKLPGAGKTINVDGIIAAVVRHMVMNHGHSLSGTGEYGD